jgi:hypothetical protein
MTARPWRVRAARSTDEALLGSFAGTFDPHATENDPRLLLVFGQGSRPQLVGVAAHERVLLQGGDGRTFAATKLQVAALSLSWQGKSFEDGTRASDVLMSAVMTDLKARLPPRHARVLALVHEDNIRSIALCRRYGLTQELSRPHPQYLRLVTPSL